MTMELKEQKKTSRLAIMIQTDKNKEQVYNACKEKVLNGKDIAELLGFTLNQAQAYLDQLEKDKHVTKYKFYNKARRRWFLQYKSTDLVYKARTEEQLAEHLAKVYKKRSTLHFGEGKYDQLISNNPNLRKVKLFEEKSQEYFKQKLKKMNKGSIGSSFSTFDNYAD